MNPRRAIRQIRQRRLYIRATFQMEDGMKALAEVCAPAVDYSYRSIDRVVLNAHIPTLQTPAAMVRFLREVCGKPILSGLVFKGLTDRFVAQVQRGNGSSRWS